MKKKFDFKIVLLFLLLFSIACDDDMRLENRPGNCPEVIDLGSFDMEENSMNFIPYNESTKRIIYSDSLGNEFAAEIANYDLDHHALMYLTEHSCPDNENFTFQYSLDAQTKSLEANFTDFNFKVLFRAAVSVMPPVAFNGIVIPNDFTLLRSDYLNVSLLHSITATMPVAQISILIDPRNNDNLTLDHPDQESFFLHGKEFRNVYVHDEVIQQDAFSIMYNVQHGLIGIENHDKSISLKYERVEF